MGKIKNLIRKFISVLIAILLPVIPLLANPGNPVYATTNPYPSIAGGAGHTIALKSDGTVWSWGLNTDGQLGDGTIITRYTPVQVQGLSNKTITSVAAGNNSSYFLASDGTVWS
ncbi:RCC1 domain-containing protein, partial [Desulfosporosinus sp. I2]|uniref:RCC1 domain-containing protein n=1 Tax=Desulfosporosinus sp. I2 TaxID=1617025 RepID=UPI0005EEB11B